MQVSYQSSFKDRGQDIGVGKMSWCDAAQGTEHLILSDLKYRFRVVYFVYFFVAGVVLVNGEAE